MFITIVDGISGVEAAIELPQPCTANGVAAFLQQSVFKGVFPKFDVVQDRAEAITLSHDAVIPVGARIMMYFQKGGLSEEFSGVYSSKNTREAERIVQDNLEASLRCLNAPVTDHLRAMEHSMKSAKEAGMSMSAKLEAAQQNLPHLEQQLKNQIPLDRECDKETLLDRFPLKQISDSLAQGVSVLAQPKNEIDKAFSEVETLRRSIQVPTPLPEKRSVDSLREMVREKSSFIKRAMVDVQRIRKTIQRASQVIDAAKTALDQYEMVLGLSISYPKAVDLATRRTQLRRTTSRLLRVLDTEQSAVEAAQTEFWKQHGNFPLKLIPGLRSRPPPLMPEEDEVDKRIGQHVPGTDEDQWKILLDTFIEVEFHPVITELHNTVASERKNRSAEEQKLQAALAQAVAAQEEIQRLHLSSGSATSQLAEQVARLTSQLDSQKLREAAFHAAKDADAADAACRISELTEASKAGTAEAAELRAAVGRLKAENDKLQADLTILEEFRRSAQFEDTQKEKESERLSEMKQSFGSMKAMVRQMSADLETKDAIIQILQQDLRVMRRSELEAELVGHSRMFSKNDAGAFVFKLVNNSTVQLSQETCDLWRAHMPPGLKSIVMTISGIILSPSGVYFAEGRPVAVAAE